MNIKQFLKPDWRKIVILALFIVFVSVFFQTSVMGGCCTTETGYFELPLQSLKYRVTDCSYHLAPPGCEPNPSLIINYPYLVFNSISWYLFSCFIVWIYGKVKKKK